MESQPLQEAQIAAVPTSEAAAVPNNGNHVRGDGTCAKQEEACAQTTGLDPQTGLLYSMTGIQTAISFNFSLLHWRSKIEEGQTTRTDVEQPTVDIFSTAIASADIDMDSSAFANDGDYFSLFF